MKIAVIILAAGQGKRMRSTLPKVLHTLGGKSMLEHVLASSALLFSDKDTSTSLPLLEPVTTCVVTGHEAKMVSKALENHSVDEVLQKEQSGTGDAVKKALPSCKGADVVLVLYGDVPLVRPETLKKLVRTCNGEHLALLTARVNDPSGYGRILRNHKNDIESIVEEKDANPEQKSVKEINTGIMAIPGRHIESWLNQLTNNNAQGEYYLTDIVALAVLQGGSVQSVTALSPWEFYGVNNRKQQAVLERHYQREQADLLMEKGVTLMDPERLDIRGSLSVGHDISIDINCIFEGEVHLGNNIQIGQGCVIRNTVIEDNAIILPHSVIHECHIGPFCQVGPFAHLRPGSCLSNSVKIGNFVELKKSNIGKGTKINHLSYIGDTETGKNVNIGAGTITCNYDGVNKHKTTIGDHAFIGSNTSLVAPVNVGEDASTGAGSTITHDIEKGKLAVGRSRQKIIDNWKKPVKKD